MPNFSFKNLKMTNKQYELTATRWVKQICITLKSQKWPQIKSCFSQILNNAFSINLILYMTFWIVHDSCDFNNYKIAKSI